MVPEDVFAAQGGFAAFVAPTGENGDRREPVFYRLAKRLIDLGAALAGLAMLAPLLPFIIALIKLEAEGPILFRQKRVGLRGRVFTCFKFRSMEVGAEDRKAELQHLNEAKGAAFKIKDDPRITSVGRFLRRAAWTSSPG